jgi:hypothetical protein
MYRTAPWVRLQESWLGAGGLATELCLRRREQSWKLGNCIVKKWAGLLGGYVYSSRRKEQGYRLDNGIFRQEEQGCRLGNCIFMQEGQGCRLDHCNCGKKDSVIGWKTVFEAGRRGT